MTDKKFLLLSLIALLILGGYYLAVHRVNSAEEINVVDRQTEPPLPAPTAAKEIIDTTTAPTASNESTNPQGKDPQLQDAHAVISKALPAWMIEDGMNYKDSREIFGHTVLRSRSRYQWEDGGLMEVEITDIGVGADDSVVQALGFDLSVDEESTETGYKLVQDEDGVLINNEYDSIDQGGSLQILIGDRYLIEIQIEQLPEAAFQEILDEHIVFDELYKTLKSGS